MITLEKSNYSKLPEKKKQQMRKASGKWKKNHREHHNKMSRIYNRRYRKRIREKVFNHYGNKCVNCGINDKRVLTIDHIDNNGGEHRREIKKFGQHFYFWLIQNEFPKGFQTLCFNCQWLKRLGEIK